eukprot:6213311-Pleurochrysis_carterae.AAC.1
MMAVFTRCGGGAEKPIVQLHLCHLSKMNLAYLNCFVMLEVATPSLCSFTYAEKSIMQLRSCHASKTNLAKLNCFVMLEVATPSLCSGCFFGTTATSGEHGHHLRARVSSVDETYRRELDILAMATQSAAVC